jgi:hypothetical protein
MLHRMTLILVSRMLLATKQEHKPASRERHNPMEEQGTLHVLRHACSVGCAKGTFDVDENGVECVATTKKRKEI